MSRIKQKLKVLHLDDDIFETERVQKALEKHPIEAEFQVTSTQNAEEYLKIISGDYNPDIVLLDIHVGDDQPTGIELAIKTREISKNTVILICSTADDVRTIAGCLGAGVDDFISKNSDKGELSLRVYNGYRLAKLKQGGFPEGATRLKTKPVGATMNKIAQRVPLIIQSAISAVFVRGESGTGKEVVADLFGASLPPGTPYVKVNCGAIAPTLLESELFGYVKGAFTGALTDKKGLLESASGGWIFLDEVATLTPSAQVALLRVLESQEITRVGATKPTLVNMRVISATNEHVESLIKRKKFRGDLWQRLRETEIELPPLRQRSEEIPRLIEHFCQKMPGGPYTASGPVVDVLGSCQWKQGNIRELRNCLRAMTEMHINKLLTPLAIPERIWGEVGRSEPRPDASANLQQIRSPWTISPRPISLTIEWQPVVQSFDDLSYKIMAEGIRMLGKDHPELSLVDLTHLFGLTQAEISKKIMAIVQTGIASSTEIGAMLGTLVDQQSKG